MNLDLRPMATRAPVRIGAAVTVILGVAALLYVGLKDSLLFPYKPSLVDATLGGWRTYGGTWTLNEGILDNLSGARGDKAVTGSENWSDYEVESDLRLNADPADSLWGDAGVIFRVTDPSIGVDSYDGYYVGIGSEGDLLVLGRANYSWARLNTTPLGVPARRGKWFHLRVLAKGCYFEATAEELSTHTRATLSFFNHDCSKRSGAAGVRTYGLPASWRNFVVHRIGAGSKPNS